jgi:hypothetical protein
VGVEIVNGFDTERRKPKVLMARGPLLTTASQARQRSTGVDPVVWPFLEQFTFKYARERLFKAFQLVSL